MCSPGPWQWPSLPYKDRLAAGSRGIRALSVLLRSHTSLTASHQCSVFGRPTPIRSRLTERLQNHGWSDPAGRDSAGCNHILMTVDVSCSRVSHICILVLLGDELRFCEVQETFP